MTKSLNRLATMLAVVVTGACADSDASTTLDPAFSSNTSPELVECPVDVTRSTQGNVLPLGGSVTLDGHSVSVPMGAVLLPTDIGISAPAGQYMQINLSANGQDHYQFRAPLTVTLSYARCSRANIDKGPLSVWLVDEETGALLQNMGGVDDKQARTVTFTTDHFSGYAIAN